MDITHTVQCIDGAHHLGKVLRSETLLEHSDPAQQAAEVTPWDVVLYARVQEAVSMKSSNRPPPPIE